MLLFACYFVFLPFTGLLQDSVSCCELENLSSKCTLLLRTWREQVPPKRWQQFTTLHVVTSQKKVITAIIS
jgi:hypothetical protein